MEPSYTGPRSFLVSLIFNFEVVLLVTSLLFFLTASVGLLGGLRENTCLLKTFSTTMMVLSCLGAFVGIFMAFLPWLTRNFFLSHVTDDFVVHYRDKADYKNVSTSYLGHRT
ncbi:hypothetical protein HPB48_011427 [Haemaphysalis longicornis]|uniref:Uncharacterized protein n=1 Tax=Haemaphysalis longicornis TaxID=44386 RepID=A0A9J6GK02_HAELO|nr:hypothetical protein HPB48_011427 [Haemaphysalis longicornis]